MNRKSLLVFMMVLIFSLQAVVGQAADPGVVVLKASEEEIQRLTAEVKALKGKLSLYESRSQREIYRLEEEVRYLKGVLEKVRDQVGNFQARPTSYE